jgi:hypothetical protein
MTYVMHTIHSTTPATCHASEKLCVCSNLRVDWSLSALNCIPGAVDASP